MAPGQTSESGGGKEEEKKKKHMQRDLAKSAVAIGVILRVCNTVCHLNGVWPIRALTSYTVAFILSLEIIWNKQTAGGTCRMLRQFESTEKCIVYLQGVCGVPYIISRILLLDVFFLFF